MKSKYFTCLHCGKEQKLKGKSYAGKYCSNKCQADYQVDLRIRYWLEDGKDWGDGQIPAWAKKHLSSVFGYACSVCGISTHNNLPISLECDHVDGNHLNNTVENLRLICPNCHSQTPTYKAKNKGNGRTYRLSTRNKAE